MSNEPKKEDARTQQPKLLPASVNNRITFAQITTDLQKQKATK